MKSLSAPARRGQVKSTEELLQNFYRGCHLSELSGQSEIKGDPVRADLSAKSPVHPTHLYGLKQSVRGQVRSHTMSRPFAQTGSPG